MNLSKQQISRYSRHIRLKNIGLEGQKRIMDARILIVGLGGLGSPAALYLAAAGIKTIGLADFDKVEEHNLQRQIIHNSSCIRDLKVDSAANQLLKLNPELIILKHDQGINIENAKDLISQYDLVIDGSDNFPTRYLVNDASYLTSVPLISGAIFQFEGQVSVFNSHEMAPCYRCLFPELPKPGTVPNCSEVGVLGALCGIVGSTMAMEALKFITRTGTSLSGKLLIMDTLENTFRKLNIQNNPNCPLCSPNPEITKLVRENYEFVCESENENNKSMNSNFPLEISVQEAKAYLDENSEVTMIDVREDFERDLCSIQPSIHIPMTTIPDNLDKINKEHPVLVHCHHGMRSLNVVQYLREKGYENAINVAGGIEQWAIEIEPTMNRY